MLRESVPREYSDFRYRPAKGLWVVTAYYNPCGYGTRFRNYQIFAETLRRSGVPLLTVECAFGDQPFTLEKSPNVVQVRSSSVIWQKERLLNLATSWLPSSCRYVAWLDCDLLFENKEWAVETAALLDEVPLVQVFETCNRLSEGNFSTTKGRSVRRSFASVTPKDPSVLKLSHFETHGHTGYGWAARRSLLDRHGLYEFAIIGSGDHFMAHAAFGDEGGKCLELMSGEVWNQIKHFLDWAEPFADSVAGRVRATSGEVVHLWHGDLENRRYFERSRDLIRLGFNPYTDLVASPGKPLEWNPSMNKPELVTMFEKYFSSRQEDGSFANQAIA